MQKIISNSSLPIYSHHQQHKRAQVSLRNFCVLLFGFLLLNVICGCDASRGEYAFHYDQEEAIDGEYRPTSSYGMPSHLPGRHYMVETTGEYPAYAPSASATATLTGHASHPLVSSEGGDPLWALESSPFSGSSSPSSSASFASPSSDADDLLASAHYEGQHPYESFRSSFGASSHPELLSKGQRLPFGWTERDVEEGNRFWASAAGQQAAGYSSHNPFMSASESIPQAAFMSPVSDPKQQQQQQQQQPEQQYTTQGQGQGQFLANLFSASSENPFSRRPAADQKTIAIDSGGPSPNANPNDGVIPDLVTPKKFLNNIEKYLLHPALRAKGIRPDALINDVPFLVQAKTPGLNILGSLVVDPTFAISFLNSLERTYMGIPKPFRYVLQPILALFRMPNRKRKRSSGDSNGGRDEANVAALTDSRGQGQHQIITMMSSSPPQATYHYSEPMMELNDQIAWDAKRINHERAMAEEIEQDNLYKQYMAQFTASHYGNADDDYADADLKGDGALEKEEEASRRAEAIRSLESEISATTTSLHDLQVQESVHGHHSESSADTLRASSEEQEHIRSLLSSAVAAKAPENLHVDEDSDDDDQTTSGSEGLNDRMESMIHMDHQRDSGRDERDLISSIAGDDYLYGPPHDFRSRLMKQFAIDEDDILMPIRSYRRAGLETLLMGGEAGGAASGAAAAGKKKRKKRQAVLKHEQNYADKRILSMLVDPGMATAMLNSLEQLLFRRLLTPSSPGIAARLFKSFLGLFGVPNKTQIIRE